MTDMIALVNYANYVFRRQQKANSASGLGVGGFDRVASYSRDDMDAEFARKNQGLLYNQRGDGYWLWKPYFIKKTLEQMATGDFLFYCDAGAVFIRPITPFIKISTSTGQDITPFEHMFFERARTKRDAFILMDCDEPQYRDTRQRVASYSLWRKSDFTMDFLDEYLCYAQDERILTDIENQCGKPNHPSFSNHRHDQSIFSLLSKKHGLAAYRDPSQFGLGPKQLERHRISSPYSQIIDHTRRDGVPFFPKAYIKLRLLTGKYIMRR